MLQLAEQNPDVSDLLGPASAVYRDVMIDLETMGTTAGAAIVSIGAVTFDLTQRSMGERFYATIDLQSAVTAGLVIDAGTLMWWMKQSDAARGALTRSPRPIADVLKQFTAYLGRACPLKELRPWGNGASFDQVILSAAYRACKLPVPWSFWNERCFRTMRAMYPSVPAPRRNGTHHNALDDAEHQVEHLFAIRGKKNARTDG